MDNVVQPLRPAQVKPRIVKIDWPNDCKWLCTRNIWNGTHMVNEWSGYGRDPVSAYADWYRKNNGDKWKIG